MKIDPKDHPGKQLSVARRAQAAVRAAVKVGAIKTEAEAEAIVRSFLPRIDGYKVTLLISDELPKTVDQVLLNRKVRNDWFKGSVTCLLFRDIWGRVWSRSTGIVKKAVPTYRISGEWLIDGLGGMSWRSADRRTFVCEYRSSMEEATRSGPRPETQLVARP